MKEFKYIQKDKMLLPYLPTKVKFKEEVLVGIWQKIKDDELYEIVFHDNSNQTLNQFINFFSSDLTALSFFCMVDDKIEKPAGMCWLTNIITADKKIKRACGSFCFFREYQRPDITKAFGNMALDFWFNVLKLDVITGLTPSLNRAALAYIKRLGFSVCGEIPNYTTLSGKVCNGVISFMNSDMFLERCKNGRQGE